MTYGGAFRATAFLLALVFGGAAVGWGLTEVADPPRFPRWLWVALLGALGVAILTIFRPHLARYTGPVYAIAEGLVLGSITRVYEVVFEGIAF